MAAKDSTLADIIEVRRTLAALQVSEAPLSILKSLPVWSDYQRGLLDSIAAIAGVPTDSGDVIVFL